MRDDLPAPLQALRDYANKPVPAVDPADLRAVYEYGHHTAAKAGRHLSIGHSVYEQLCAPGADSLIVWYRSSMMSLAVQTLRAPITDAELQSMPPDAPVPFRKIPQTLCDDLNLSPLPDYVFEVFAQFPITGIPKGGMQGLPVDFPALISELLRASANSNPLP